MHCRAYLLLEREYKRIRKTPEWGIEVTPSESNIFCWYATISGLNNTIWENGCFHITIRFSESYDDEPPDIKFNTIPFHPNIDPISGQPCIELYPDNQKREPHGLSINSLLVNLQALLSNPVLDNAVNTEAANLLQTAPHIYMQLVKNCVIESKKLIEILQGQDLERERATRKQSNIQFLAQTKRNLSTDSYSKRPKQVSFDEYHRNWVQIASSQPTAIISLVQPYSGSEGIVYFKNSTERSPRRSPMYPPDGSASPSVVSKSVTVDTEQKVNKLRQKKMERISAMKQLYLNETNKSLPGSTAPVSSRTDVADGEKTTELWENEAEKLVAWTTTLEEGNEIRGNLCFLTDHDYHL